MAVINMGEDEIGDTDDARRLGIEASSAVAVDVLAVSVQLEAEAARLDCGRAGRAARRPRSR